MMLGKGSFLIVTDAAVRATPFPRTVPESIHSGAVGIGAVGFDVELPQPSAPNERAAMTMAVRIERHHGNLASRAFKGRFPQAPAIQISLYLFSGFRPAGCHR